MQNQTKRHKKLTKKRKQRKDYERRRNINRQPPSEIKEIKKDILEPVLDKDGEIKTDSKGDHVMRKIGTEIKLKRVKKIRKKNLPVIVLPKSRKNKLSKVEIKRHKIAEKNAIKTASGI